MTCCWWQLADDITVNIIGLSLKKSFHEIDVKQIPSFAGCDLATHSKSWSSRSRGISLLVFLLLVLESSSYPSGCPEEVALLVGLDGDYPSSGYVVSRLDLPHINEVKNLIVSPGFVLMMFSFSKLLVITSYFLS